MNKFMKVLAASALVATALVGCSGSSAKYAKVGFGMVISYDATAESPQQNATTATIGLDKDGKIAYIDIDVAQSPNSHDNTKSKKELKEEYGMKDVSAQMGAIKDGAEWYEQAAAFEEFCKGKTPDEVAAIETEQRDEEHTAVPKAGSDLAAGCTINIGDFKEAVAKAASSAVEVEAEKIGAGEVISYNESTKQVNTTLASVALDGEGKVVWANVDVAQSPNGKDEAKSKKELKEQYAMKDTSAAIGAIQGGAEWYEQAAAFEEYCKGKTGDEIAKTETEKNQEGSSVAKAGSDLAAGCTMGIDDFLAAIAEAIEVAQ